jgi:hypothetical protein
MRLIARKARMYLSNVNQNNAAYGPGAYTPGNNGNGNSYAGQSGGGQPQIRPPLSSPFAPMPPSWRNASPQAPLPDNGYSHQNYAQGPANSNSGYQNYGNPGPLANTSSPVRNADGTVTNIPIAQRVQASLYRTRDNLQNTINQLNQPLSPQMSANMRLLFPYGVDRNGQLVPEVRQGLIWNLQDTLNSVNKSINSGMNDLGYEANYNSYYGQGYEAGSHYEGKILVNTAEFCNPNSPKSDAMLDRFITHEFTHKGAKTVDNFYLQNNGYAAYGLNHGDPGRFNPNSYNAPYLANADTNAFVTMMYNGHFPLY